MRRRAMLSAVLLLASGLPVPAEPVGEEALSEIYESCVTAAVGNSPNVNAAQRMRYCYCVRDEVQRHFTAEYLAGLRERIAANTVTDADHERRERVYEACRGNIEGAQ